MANNNDFVDYDSSLSLLSDTDSCKEILSSIDYPDITSSVSPRSSRSTRDRRSSSTRDKPSPSICSSTTTESEVAFTPNTRDSMIRKMLATVIDTDIAATSGDEYDDCLSSSLSAKEPTSTTRLQYSSHKLKQTMALLMLSGLGVVVLTVFLLHRLISV
ncbi:hypothetical protein GEMRC1_013823 [Eukaryota sp. GEM-RC1]